MTLPRRVWKAETPMSPLPDNVRDITTARGAAHRFTRPLPGWFGLVWARVRGYGNLWREPCDNCGRTAQAHHALLSVLTCLRFRPIHVKR